MEVTKRNFLKVLPDIERSIKNSDFIAIDCEFTGLKGNITHNVYDNLSQYYNKFRLASSNFLIVQLGVCIFKYDPENKKYKQDCYNFYVFPSPVPGIGREVTFSSQASSINFLASNGFDFNKLFIDGINYLSQSDEDALREHIEEKRKLRKQTETEENYDIIKISQNDEEKINQITNKIKDFVKTATFEDELILGPYNSYIRKIIRNNVAASFKGTVTFDIVKNDKSSADYRSLSVKIKGSEAHQKEREIKKRNEEEEQLKSAIGVCQVIKYISESGKLLVGHNMYLDILHIINQFVCPLPTDYNAYKEVVNFWFPSIIDTKYVCASKLFEDKLKYTNLVNLMLTLSKEPFSIPEIEGSEFYKLSDDKAHEAGYDALVTGSCFIAMIEYIANKNNETVSYNSSSNVLEPYLNKINIMKLWDIPFTKLDGDDITPSRDNVVYLSFPKEWKHADIVKLFSPFGNINIVWISGTSAYVNLFNSLTAKKVLKEFKNSTLFNIKSYTEYQTLTNLTASVYKKVNDSPTKKRKLSELSDNSSPNKSKLESPEKTSVQHSALKISDDEFETISKKKRKRKSSISNQKNITSKKKVFEEESWD